MVSAAPVMGYGFASPAVGFGYAAPGANAFSTFAGPTYAATPMMPATAYL